MNRNKLHRRSLLQVSGGSLILHGLSLNPPTAQAAESEAERPWKMGLIADLHHGLAPDALDRLERFMVDAESKSPDCLLQLGDFNFAVDSADCMNLWGQFKGEKYHVLGNHDMDKTTKTQTTDAWEMPGPYYSFDHRGWHFVILDRNHLRLEPGRYVDYSKANFYVDSRLRGFADPEQLEWLKADLKSTELPTVVFAHQGLGMDETRDPNTASGKIEQVLETSKEAGESKVFACFCGHHHIDRYNYRSGIHYLWINSASYHWVGANYGRMAAYKDPLFTFLTFHPDQSIEVEGRQSSWLAPSPKQRSYPGWEKLNTHIQQRTLVTGRKSG